VIAYRDNGYVCVDSTSGGAFTDPSLRGIWMLDVATNSRRRLAPDGFTPSWSPDGTQIAFEYGKRIFTTPADTLIASSIATVPQVQYPRWSPDGQSISYSSGLGPAGSIWIARLDGSAHRLLRRNAFLADWYPSGTSIICSGWLDSIGGKGGILSVDVSTGLARLLYSSAPDVLVWPRVSPDGATVVFIQDGQLGRMNADGSNASPLTGLIGNSFSWSPDGSRIVFTRWDGATNSATEGVLWLDSLATSGQRQLTYHWSTQCP